MLVISWGVCLLTVYSRKLACFPLTLVDGSTVVVGQLPDAQKPPNTCWRNRPRCSSPVNYKAGPFLVIGIHSVLSRNGFLQYWRLIALRVS